MRGRIVVCVVVCGEAGWSGGADERIGLCECGGVGVVVAGSELVESGLVVGDFAEESSIGWERARGAAGLP